MDNLWFSRHLLPLGSHFVLDGSVHEDSGGERTIELQELGVQRRGDMAEGVVRWKTNWVQDSEDEGLTMRITVSSGARFVVSAIWNVGFRMAIQIFKKSG